MKTEGGNRIRWGRGLLIALSAVGIGWQAWQVGYLWLDMFYFGPTLLTSPWWSTERGLCTVLSFYPTVVILRLLHQRSAWIVALIGLAAAGLCFTDVMVQTMWGLPAFVGLHAVALAVIAFRSRQPNADGPAQTHVRLVGWRVGFQAITATQLPGSISIWGWPTPNVAWMTASTAWSVCWSPGPRRTPAGSRMNFTAVGLTLNWGSRSAIRLHLRRIRFFPPEGRFPSHADGGERKRAGEARKLR